jgi:membrane fusion protein, multidrug efflux system
MKTNASPAMPTADAALVSISISSPGRTRPGLARQLCLVSMMALALLTGACKRDSGANEQSGSEQNADDGQKKDRDGKTIDGKTEEIAIPVEVASVSAQSISASFQGTAALEAEAQAQVTSKTQGVVLAIYTEEGQRVGQGQVLARLDNDRQRLNLAQAKANLAKVENDFKRQTELFQRKLIGSDAYDRVKFDLETQRASYNLSALELSYTEIRAPISGTLTQRLVKVGNQIQPNQALFQIDDFDPLEAKVSVPERDMQKIKAGQSVQMLVDAVPGQVFVGSVARVRPIVDAKTGTFEVTAQFKDQTALLRSGMFGRINIVTAVHEQALVIPRTAIVSEDGQSLVFIVDGTKVKRVPITTGFVADGRAEIISGLTVGQQIVTLGQNALRDGSKVKVVNAPNLAKAMAPAVESAASNPPVAETAAVAEQKPAENADPKANSN